MSGAFLGESCEQQEVVSGDATGRVGLSNVTSACGTIQVDSGQGDAVRSTRVSEQMTRSLASAVVDDSGRGSTSPQSSLLPRKRGLVRWEWFAGYTFRSILLMVSFLAIGLVVSSFVLSF
jgi:hypothetical protein